MRSLNVLCLLLCLGLTVSYGQNTNEKIGYVDQQLIIERMPEFKKLNEEITLKSQQYEKVLKGKYDDYEAKSAALEKLIAGKAEQMILRDKALELDNAKRSYEEFEANAMKELRDYYTKKFMPIKQKVNEAIVFAGRQKGYSFILRMDLNPDGGDMWPVVLYARDSTSNLSADIMKNLGIDSTAASARKVGLPQMLQKK